MKEWIKVGVCGVALSLGAFACGGGGEEGDGTTKGGVDVSKILDGDNNNPVHLFVLGTTNHSNNGETGAYPEMLTMLLDAGTPEQRLKIESGRIDNVWRLFEWLQVGR